MKLKIWHLALLAGGAYLLLKSKPTFASSSFNSLNKLATDLMGAPTEQTSIASSNQPIPQSAPPTASQPSAAPSIIQSGPQTGTLTVAVGSSPGAVIPASSFGTATLTQGAPAYKSSSGVVFGGTASYPSGQTVQTVFGTADTGYRDLFGRTVSKVK